MFTSTTISSHVTVLSEGFDATEATLAPRTELAREVFGDMFGRCAGVCPASVNVYKSQVSAALAEAAKRLRARGVEVWA